MEESDDLTFVRCLGCRSLVPSTTGRCRMCGAELASRCPSCGELVPVSKEKCQCGMLIPHEVAGLSETQKKIFLVLVLVVLALVLWIGFGAT